MSTGANLQKSYHLREQSKLVLVNMATKTIFGTQAVSVLMEQAQRFDAMSVEFSKWPTLMKSQADGITKWSSKLVDAVKRIQSDAQAAVVACHEQSHSRIQELEGRANSSKRKILEANKFESSRTLKANFRLIFGPARAVENRPRSTRQIINASVPRITTIRRLCEDNPDSVIALSTGYPTKTWSEASPAVFEEIIKLVKQETEQDWPDQIVQIMDELEAERPMSTEFKNLRGMHHEFGEILAD